MTISFQIRHIDRGRLWFVRVLMYVAVPVYALAVLSGVGGCAARHGPQRSRIDHGRFPRETVGEIYALKKIDELSAEQFYQGAGSRTDLYLSYDLREVLIGEYSLRLSEKTVVIVELYVFGSPLDAFGITAELNNRKKEPSGREVLDGHDQGPTEESVSHGRYMVLVRSSFIKDREKMKSLAVDVADALPGESLAPREVSILETLVEDRSTISYDPVAVIGSRFLAPGLTAPVLLPSNRRGTIFLTVKDSKERSRAAFEDFIVSKTKGRRGVSFTLGIGEVACSLWDDAHGWITLSKKGRYIVGLSGMENPSDGWPIVSGIVTSLGE